MVKAGMNIPVVMGGILNQKVEDQPLPVDVSSNIKQLDILPCPRIGSNLGHLLDYNLRNRATN
jgi:hypothetical protein